MPISLKSIVFARSAPIVDGVEPGFLSPLAEELEVLEYQATAREVGAAVTRRRRPWW